MKLYQHNTTKLRGFENTVAKMIDFKYPYLYCVIHHFEEAISILLTTDSTDYLTVIASLLLTVICVQNSLINCSSGKTFDKLLKKPTIESKKTINYTRLMYDFIAAYNPPQDVVFDLINILPAELKTSALISVILELGRADILNSPLVSNDQALLDNISTQAILHKPEMARAVYSMTGNFNEYVKLINDSVAVKLNDKYARITVAQDLANVNDSILSQVSDLTVKNDYFLLQRVARLYEVCALKDLNIISQCLTDLQLIPRSSSEVDLCIGRIQSMPSLVLSKVLSGVYYEIISLFLQYLMESSRYSTPYSDPNIQIMKEIIKGCFIVINFLPQFFVKEQFESLVAANRKLII